MSDSFRPRIGRPRESVYQPRYPEQDHIRKALAKWVDEHEVLLEAAAEMQVSYRLLSMYRHGQRWIPDRICEALGFDPVPMTIRRGKTHNRISRGQSLIQASLKFVNAIRRRESEREQRLASRGLMLAARKYQETFQRREAIHD